MAKRRNKPDRHVPTPEEITNDPSLRWFPYHDMELIWSDVHQEFVRFHKYNADGSASLKSYAGAELTGTVQPTQIRRWRSYSGGYKKEKSDGSG